MEFYLPPLCTTLRLNSFDDGINDALKQVQEYLQQTTTAELQVVRHEQLSDTVVIPSRVRKPSRCNIEVIVDVPCGMAVLRGAQIFTPGVLSCPKSLARGDEVSVFADLSRKCLQGMTSYTGEKLYLGNAVALLSRYDMFVTKTGGVAFTMTDPVISAPALNNVFDNQLLFLQNLPSIVAGHVLSPTPDDYVLDMCAAPGGKTAHLFRQMRGRGTLVACDRTSKVQRIKKNLENVCGKSLTEFPNVKVLKLDSRTLSTKDVRETHNLPSSFNKILLDAPCSALGQKPRTSQSSMSGKQLNSLSSLQQQLFCTAIELLSDGGTLVYSTCTTTYAENEGIVAWALEKFPCLELCEQTPHIGGCGREGFDNCNLSSEQLKKLQYFSIGEPVTVQGSVEDGGTYFDFSSQLDDCQLKGSVTDLANNDTIGFFIAKFFKKAKHLTG